MSKDSSCKDIKICSVGGQALMEGIMMRGPHGMSQVIRNPEGELVIESKEIEMISKKYKILGWPIIRGTVSLVDSMRVGMKALFDSADIAMTEEDPDYKPSKFDLWLEKKLGDKAMGVIMAFSVVIAVAFSVGLFILLPNLIAGLIIPNSKDFQFLYHACEGVLRIAIFMTYMIVIAKMNEIKRVYMYHGAEHKTIHCFEKGMDLTVENVRKCSKHHPRCGTAFMFVVMVISILIYSLVPRFDNIFANIGLRLLLLPVVIGITYEFNRFAGRHDGKITAILRAPGMAMQHFTTIEPDDTMIEVAIVALVKALEFEKEPVSCPYFEEYMNRNKKEEEPAPDAETEESLNTETPAES